MLQEVLAALNSSQAISAIAIGVVVFLIRGLAMIGKVFDFHDKHFVEKRHRRLQSLRESIKGEDAFARYLDQAIKLEAFRIASGVRASTLKAEALITLVTLGYWDMAQIRRIARYLHTSPEETEPKIKFDLGDKISAWYGLISGGALFIIGLLLAITLWVKPSPINFLAGSVMLAVMTLSGLVLANDFARYRLAQRIQLYLAKHPNTFFSSESTATEINPGEVDSTDTKSPQLNTSETFCKELLPEDNLYLAHQPSR
ncbi:hypothetical protein IB274_06100 [Pseudomonas sp. PDM18]|uniref:hypothetical protein n=1 Tax=Pseudomonas sp. PDM18 TaxID=2769253 RepID=UPI001782DBB9|nr:hypothetical protein [Pseudomonas sp. PDM18]MBD9676264.1 hypothetical protein [Pseudomonas sp. PDM18]